jgi:hypothetical protein
MDLLPSTTPHSRECLKVLWLSNREKWNMKAKEVQLCPAQNGGRNSTPITLLSVLSANLGCRSIFWSRRRRGRLWEDGPSSEIKDSVLPITPQNTSRHPGVCVPMGKRLKEWLHIQLLPHWNCIATNYTRAWSITISICGPVSSQRTTLRISKWAIKADNDERSFHSKSPKNNSVHCTLQNAVDNLRTHPYPRKAWS